MSEPLTKLATALAKFQADHHAAGKDGRGNYGTYTTLAGALAAVQPACAHGLCHTQTLQPINDDTMVLRTTLMHVSGESIVSDIPLPIRFEAGRGNAMQAMGSALTYARRYGLLAVYGIAGDDDDGETAAAPTKAVKKTATPTQKAAPAAKPKDAPSPAAPADPPLTDEAKEEIVAAIRSLKQSDAEGFDRFTAAFKEKYPFAGNFSPHHIQSVAQGEFCQAFFQQLTAS